jgi:ComF family protein
MTVREAGTALARGFLDLVFAPVCLGCGAAVTPGSANGMVCRACWSRLREIPLPRCERCWTPRPPAPPSVAPLESCPTCALLPPAVRAVRSVCVMEGPARTLVHALKYGGWHALAPELGQRMAGLSFPLELREEVRCVVPVPLSRVRLRTRGYNPAELLGRSVARARGWRDGAGILERTRSTDTQTALHPAERLANVAGAFRVRAERRSELHREHLLVVDDVWTTGATALACAAALTSAGARAVSVLTFARALPDLRL